MNLLKSIKWLGTAYVQTFLFCAAVAAAIGILMTFIAYPVQTLTALAVGFIVYTVFAFIFD